MDTERIHCPYCGEPIVVAVDRSVRVQEYVEDCDVCCRPMVLRVAVDEDGTADITARAESD